MTERRLSYHRPSRASPIDVVAAAIIGVIIGIAVGAFCGSFLLILLELAVNLLQLPIGRTPALLTTEVTLVATSILGALLGGVLFARSVAEAPDRQCDAAPNTGLEAPQKVEQSKVTSEPS